MTEPIWITPEGIDLHRMPFEAFIHQSLADDDGQFRSACHLLGAMAHQDRTDAGIYLLGLLFHYRDDLRRLERIVAALGEFRSASAAQALFGELRRVKGSNATRGYVNAVLKAVERLPAELIREGLTELAADTTQSYKMRKRYEEILSELRA